MRNPFAETRSYKPIVPLTDDETTLADNGVTLDPLRYARACVKELERRRALQAIEAAKAEAKVLRSMPRPKPRGWTHDRNQRNWKRMASRAKRALAAKQGVPYVGASTGKKSAAGAAAKRVRDREYQRRRYWQKKGLPCPPRPEGYEPPGAKST